MKVELLLELSGLSRQEIIVIKACAPDAKSFESVAATLINSVQASTCMRDVA